MAEKKRNCSSKIGGQAVLEGVMMKNKDDYAVAIRKPNGEIEIDVDYYKGVIGDSGLKKVPFLRGIFNFIDSMILGTRLINYSASFYDDEEAEPTKLDKALDKISKGKGEKIIMGFTTILAIVLAVGIFILLPFYLTDWMKGFINNASLIVIIEGILRISIFLIYVTAISFMNDIRRLYSYHGAEHKCINCIENGRPLTVRDVMRSSRLHRRCGTSFMFFVIFVSIIIFFFIRVDNIWMRAGLRIALIPLIAGISYELIRWAGNNDNIIVRILSAPGMLIQRLTTKEPDEDMVKVAISAVEAIFDWKAYLKESFGYDVDESWMEEEATAEET
ncbi:MAG: DUF1385 domain-containing protein [Lachnospiraceae bacterium]|nr:DUF1385 domain-containing protein [Lachnospiraceae bacterium]MCL2254003.1 DUF1385 domain-containing protein [Lachnospiraceae bacterium]